VNWRARWAFCPVAPSSSERTGMRKVVVDASALYLPEGDSDAVVEALRSADSVAILDLAFCEAADAL